MTALQRFLVQTKHRSTDDWKRIWMHCAERGTRSSHLDVSRVATPTALLQNLVSPLPHQQLFPPATADLTNLFPFQPLNPLHCSKYPSYQLVSEGRRGEAEWQRERGAQPALCPLRGHGPLPCLHSPCPAVRLLLIPGPAPLLFLLSLSQYFSVPFILHTSCQSSYTGFYTQSIRSSYPKPWSSSSGLKKPTRSFKSTTKTSRLNGKRRNSIHTSRLAGKSRYVAGISHGTRNAFLIGTLLCLVIGMFSTIQQELQ